MPDVRALCRERYGDVPCTEIEKSDGTFEEYECNDWCPLLQRTIEESDDADLIDDARINQRLGRRSPNSI